MAPSKSLILVYLVLTCSACKRISHSECICTRSYLLSDLTEEEIQSYDVIQKIDACKFAMASSGSYLFLATRVLKSTNIKKTKNYVLDAIHGGLNAEFVLADTLVKELFLKDPDFMEVVVDALENNVLEGRNLAFRNLINEIYIRDQSIRTEGFAFHKGEEVRDMRAIDSINLEEIINIFNFPEFEISEKDLSSIGVYELYLVLLHTMINCDRFIYDDIMSKVESAVRNGAMNPQYFASIVDRRMSQGEGKDLVYYQYNLYKQVPPQIDDVEAIRFCLGLGFLERSATIDSIYQEGCKICN